jgi:hypothetical protein
LQDDFSQFTKNLHFEQTIPVFGAIFPIGKRAQFTFGNSYEHRILADTFYPTPRDDVRGILSEAKKTAISPHEQRAYPTVASVEFNIAYVAEPRAVAKVYYVLLSEARRIYSFHTITSKKLYGGRKKNRLNPW